ncbi:arginyltransferase [Gluconobacter cerinus]|uniref:arginyltransferase n=1 Tax=Gluconobacter cerinus TaxID=38307 RepID=UPI001B8C8C88|nr:arginyltransferase [Gluconobacter cerinus]
MQHRPQLFYTTEPAPCPYLPDRMERKVLTDLSGPNASALHDRLSQAGFRRSHTIAYAPVCIDCRACKPLRLPVGLFTPSRAQKRVWKHHENTNAVIIPPVPTQEQFALFHAYQESRHTDGDMAHMSWQDYVELISNTPVETVVVEFRTPEGQLVCVSLVDIMSDGLSAVYTFYDTSSPTASWGTYSILTLINLTKRRGSLHLYLGYYVPGSRKMAYKATFRPAETFQGGHWETLAAPV